MYHNYIYYTNVQFMCLSPNLEFITTAFLDALQKQTINLKSIAKVLHSRFRDIYFSELLNSLKIAFATIIVT